MAEGAALRPAVCRCGVDVHSHVVPHDFPAYLGAKVPAQWPSMAPAHECHRSVMIAGKLYRAVADKAWSTARRLADLPAMGLTRQAISPMPELLSYWMDAGRRAAAAALHQRADRGDGCTNRRGALIGLGAVPLQDIDLAIAELRHVMTLPGFAGVEIGSNINGVPVGHASLDPFFEACEALGAAVFVHALKPAGMDRLVGPAPLQQVLAYPTDVGLAAASAITGNLLLRRPRLRIAFSHGGGTLASLLPRLQQSWSVFPALAESVQAAPAEQARKLFYDTLVFDAMMLRMLVATLRRLAAHAGQRLPIQFRRDGASRSGRGRRLRRRRRGATRPSQRRDLSRPRREERDMSSPWIAGLRSVALNVPDLAAAEAFYTNIWHLDVAVRSADALYLRGSGADHHLLALHAGATTAIRHVTLRARSGEALRASPQPRLRAGGRVLPDRRALDEPAGGTGLLVRDPRRPPDPDRARRRARMPKPREVRDRPTRLAHVVLNSHAVEATQRFFEQALGFTLADRTRIMAFLNCNHDHHSIALGDTDNDALNHIAFLMPDLESVMRGGGRMKDAGFAIEWGPGRHGPGDNAFNYFVGPFGEVIEYTAEVQQVDESYRVGSPTDWTWPPGRVDQWGISSPPSARLKQAQRAVFFTPSS